MKNVLCTIQYDVEAKDALTVYDGCKTINNLEFANDRIYVYFTYDTFKKLYLSEADFVYYCENLISLLNIYHLCFIITPGGYNDFYFNVLKKTREDMSVDIISLDYLHYYCLEKFNMNPALKDIITENGSTWFFSILERMLSIIYEKSKTDNK